MDELRLDNAEGIGEPEKQSMEIIQTVEEKRDSKNMSGMPLKCRININ